MNASQNDLPAVKLNATISKNDKAGLSIERASGFRIGCRNNAQLIRLGLQHGFEQLGHLGRVTRDLEATLFHHRQLGLRGVLAP